MITSLCNNQGNKLHQVFLPPKKIDVFLAPENTVSIEH